MNITKKPVRKCNSCELNFRSYCGVYEVPRLMWDGGKCPGYHSEGVFMKYKATRALIIRAKDEARRKRQEVQALRKTEPHHSGQMYTVVTSDKPSDRKKSAALHANYVTGKGTRKMARAATAKPVRRARAAVAGRAR